MIQPGRFVLFQGDSFRLMQRIRTSCVDAVITDPPYGTTALAWDHKIDLEAWWGNVDRILKPNGVAVVFSQQPFTTEVINSNRRHFRYELIWKKTAPVGFLDAKVRPMRIHENILVFCRQFRGRDAGSRATYNPQMVPGKPYRKKADSRVRTASHYGHVGQIVEDQVNEGWRYPVDVLEFANRYGKSLHPTQKPVPLLSWLVRTFTNENELVMDMFMGSGRTGVACAETGRRFVGMEQDANYFQVSVASIREALGLVV